MLKMNFLKEFKEFAMKGNLIDMAVAFHQANPICQAQNSSLLLPL